MDYRLILLYFLIAVFTCLKAAHTEEVSKSSGKELHRVKRLDVKDAGGLIRVKRLEDGEIEKPGRVRRATDNHNEGTSDVDSEDEKERKALYGPNYGPNGDDETHLLKLMLNGEFHPDQENHEEPITKRLDKHFMKIKQKWKLAMKKRKQQKYRLKKKVAPKMKEGNSKDTAQQKTKRKQYQKKSKN